MNRFNKNLIVTSLVATMFGFGGATAFAATAPALGTVAPYAIVSDTWTNTLNAGLETAVTGAVCYTTPPGTAPISINGVTTTPLTQATTPCPPQTGIDQAAALSVINGQACTLLGVNVSLDSVIIGANPPGTFPPGCYYSTGTMDITLSTTVTLDGPGAYIFRSGGALTTGANSQVVLANGASAGDVFWAPVGAASLGANSGTSATPTFVGTIIADALGSTGINLGHFANLLGRVLAFGHTVTTDSNTIAIPGASSLATLHVVKLVVGGTSVSSDFTVSVKTGGVDVAGSPLAGAVSPGTSYSLAAGTYNVSEITRPFYAQSFSGPDCDSNGNVTLLAGDDKTCTIVNTDIPRGSTATFPSSAPALVPPLISVTKIPTPLALPSGPGSVIYDYVVANVGTVAMSNITVVDNSCTAMIYVSGDVNTDSKLDLNEVWKYSCTKVLSQTTTNTVTATGQANGFTATDFANATVVVGVPIVPPLINVVKKPSAFALSFAGPVTYAYTVTNPGAVSLSDVRVVDDKCAPVFGPSGDVNNNAMLDVGEVWTYACQTNLLTNTVNTATATGKANGLTAIDYSVATVIVSTPSLPNTGISPDKNIFGYVAALFGALILVSTSVLATLRKRKA